MAELGDKTQLVTASLAWMSMVFVSSTLALWSVALLGIFAGKQLVRFTLLPQLRRRIPAPVRWWQPTVV